MSKLEFPQGSVLLSPHFLGDLTSFVALQTIYMTFPLSFTSFSSPKPLGRIEQGWHWVWVGKNQRAQRGVWGPYVKGGAYIRGLSSMDSHRLIEVRRAPMQRGSLKWAIRDPHSKLAMHEESKPQQYEEDIHIVGADKSCCQSLNGWGGYLCGKGSGGDSGRCVT